MVDVASPAAANRTAQAPGVLTWGLCIATYNRADYLEQCIAHALAQTRPPAEIVIADASDDWQDNRDRIAALMADSGSVLRYDASSVRSSTIQRNAGIERARADVLFMIDDDSFMYPTCAEEIMRVYDADAAGEIVGVSASAKAAPPSLDAGGPAEAGQLRRKRSGRRRTDLISRRLRRSPLGKWFMNKVLFQNMGELFIRYDDRAESSVPAGLQHLDVKTVEMMPGFAMTVRRDIALKEPFDPTLRYYAALEDLDATYRYGRHGTLLRAKAAALHHFEAASGRIPPRVVIVFQMLNLLVFILRNAADRDRHIASFRLMLYRRLVSEVLKDLASLRLSLPQARGVLFAMRHWREVAAMDRDRLEGCYPRFQQRILENSV
jgi:GT2 family glycosyltransferase